MKNDLAYLRHIADAITDIDKYTAGGKKEFFATKMIQDAVIRNLEIIGEAARRLVKQLQRDPLPADTILNVNVPDCPWSEIRGFEVTRLGHRHRAEPVVKTMDPRGRDMYWIGPAGAEQDAGPGTDFDAIRRKFISVTPIHVDLTRYQALDKVAGWMTAIGTGSEQGTDIS